jgi:hypothetical protein
VIPVEQVPKGEPSSEHAKVEPLSLAVNWNVALEAFVGFAGPEVTVVSGAVWSTVQLRVAGDGSTFPAESIACTAKVWVPSERFVSVVPDVAQLVNAPPSSEHSNEEPAFVDA